MAPPSREEDSDAPEHPLPSTSFYSVEYPSYVSSMSSVPEAVRTLGGQPVLDQAFKKSLNIVELNFRPENLWSHPICGDVVPTGNLVLKVTKRRKKKDPNIMDVDADGVSLTGTIGEFKAEVVGSIPKTIRFRSMADFQFQPDVSDRVAELRDSLTRMDADALQGFKFAPENEDYMVPVAGPSSAAEDGTPMKSNLRLFPPPLFSRQAVQQNYNYKANPSSVIQSVVDEETGLERTRLVHKGRWKTLTSSMLFEHRDKLIEPTEIVEAKRSEVNQPLLRRLQELLARRPIWTRVAILNNFSDEEVRLINNSRLFLPLVCYVFNDGPFRDTLVRYGHDPRKNPADRIYQRLFFRGGPIQKESIVDRRHGNADDNRRTNKAPRNTHSHIFDGKSDPSEASGYQLCDITDPLLRTLVEDARQVRDTCHEKYGWYTEIQLERIRAIMRRKYDALCAGKIVTDAECSDLLLDALPSNSNPKKRFNKAKRAALPEELTAARLALAVQREMGASEPGSSSQGGG